MFLVETVPDYDDGLPLLRDAVEDSRKHNTEGGKKKEQKPSRLEPSCP